MSPGKYLHLFSTKKIKSKMFSIKTPCKISGKMRSEYLDLFELIWMNLNFKKLIMISSLCIFDNSNEFFTAATQRF
jgi:hypothetical protein